MNERRFEKVAVTDLVEDPAYQTLPNWDEEKLVLTISELRAEGDVRVPVVIDESNRVLDGHQRVAAAKGAKLSQITCERVACPEEIDKLRYVFGQLNRRHMTRDELRQAAREAVQRMHEYSDSRIALTIGIVTDKTVRGIRRELIAEGLIPDHDTLIGVGGTPQKAKKGGKKLPDEKPTDEKPTDEKPTDEKPADEAKPADKPVVARPTGERVEPDAGEGHPQERDERPPAEGDDPQGGRAGAGVQAAEEPKPADVEKGGKPEQPEPPKPKKARRSSNDTARQPMVAKVEQGRLVVECRDVGRLPAGLAEVLCVVVQDPQTTHYSVALDANKPTLVIFDPKKP